MDHLGRHSGSTMLRTVCHATPRTLPSFAGIRTITSDVPLVALFGSSQVIYGLDCPTLAAARPGASCLNLATNGGTPSDMLYVARDLDARARHRMTVAALTPATLWGPFK